eukprot:CAMPEP_0172070582 /NCGR_PEP_ID=MMETSP1043-20130122/13340_1 /TAXON_ID=464988 /ORGANISM="Hemiselmis andersenii, Strain CCMP441" /LENGTH=90 /DNA_ID=CAMNT_0012730955 /DNA_START=264 /DNA_END=537 /DNA_ORIENTATION=-
MPVALPPVTRTTPRLRAARSTRSACDGGDLPAMLVMAGPAADRPRQSVAASCMSRLACQHAYMCTFHMEATLVPMVPPPPETSFTASASL